MLSSTNCAILAAGNVSRSAGHFPSSAAVEGKRQFRFSPLRVAADCSKALLCFGRVHVPPFRGTPRWYPPLIHFTPLPLSAFLHTWRDLLGVSTWILRTIQFGYTHQFARYPLSPSSPSRAWPPAEWPEERAHPSQADHIFGSLSGLNLDAGPSGPCSGREHSVVRGLLQARSACVSGPVSLAPRPHGGSFPGSSLGAAPYETIPLVDKVPGYEGDDLQSALPC